MSEVQSLDTLEALQERIIRLCAMWDGMVAGLMGQEELEPIPLKKEIFKSELFTVLRLKNHLEAALDGALPPLAETLVYRRIGNGKVEDFKQQARAQAFLKTKMELLAKFFDSLGLRKMEDAKEQGSPVKELLEAQGATYRKCQQMLSELLKKDVFPIDGYGDPPMKDWGPLTQYCFIPFDS